MSALIGLIGMTGLVVLFAGALVAYRWNRARNAVGADSAAGAGSDGGVSRTGRDTQAGRI